MPTDIKNSALFNAPVKEVTLIKKSMTRDAADAYLKNINATELDFEVRLKAKRKGMLGPLKNFIGKDIHKCHNGYNRRLPLHLHHPLVQKTKFAATLHGQLYRYMIRQTFL